MVKSSWSDRQSSGRSRTLSILNKVSCFPQIFFIQTEAFQWDCFCLVQWDDSQSHKGQSIFVRSLTKSFLVFVCIIFFVRILTKNFFVHILTKNFFVNILTKTYLSVFAQKLWLLHSGNLTSSENMRSDITDTIGKLINFPYFNSLWNLFIAFALQAFKILSWFIIDMFPNSKLHYWAHFSLLIN